MKSASFDQPFACIGVMSGTSMDGIDAVYARFTPRKGPWLVEALHHHPHSFPDGYAEKVQQILNTNDMKSAFALSQYVSELYAEAVKSLIQKAGVSPSDIDFIGAHGQTVFHQPPHENQPGLSIQALELSNLAQAVGIDTVGRFRSRDMMLGGQGAPMACYGHEKLWGNPDETIVVLNLGGIANISLLEEGRCTLGYDTGPANLWMDTLMGWHTEGKTKLDRDGQCAAKGTIDEAMLNTLLSHAYFQQTPPKSTGFEAFGEVDLSPQRDQWLSLSMEDALATANYATARSIADAIHHDSRIQGVTRLIACGGGAYNPVLIKNLQTLLPDIQVQTSNEMGFAPDTIEGLCFGLLAHACWHRIPANIPAVTGATSPCICGEIALASPAGS